ncbi:MAG: site-2 protease family protein [Patescibacteria group bacterium]|nr:site-2 protease family protein [Patescibacteria group bacterium]
MLFGEPDRTQADLHLSVLGFPVRVHPLFWIVSALLGANAADGRALVLWIIAMFVGVSVHELGHAIVMRWNGFQPSITLYGLGGAASYGPNLYGAVSLPPWRQIGISVAGPAAGFLLAAIVCLGLVVSGAGIQVTWGLPFGLELSPANIVGGLLFTQFVDFLLLVTVAYGILNLMPIYPLDGGHVARELFLMAMPRDGIRHSLILSMLCAASIAVLGVTRGSFLLGIMFGYMAYGSFNALQRYQGRGPW